MSNKSCSIDNHNHPCTNCHSNCNYSQNKAACPDMFHFLIKLFIHNPTILTKTIYKSRLFYLSVMYNLQLLSFDSILFIIFI